MMEIISRLEIVTLWLQHTCLQDTLTSVGIFHSLSHIKPRGAIKIQYTVQQF